MSSQASIRKWGPHKLDAAIEQRLQRLAKAEGVARIAVMPDVHLAGDVCNGVVVASERLIYPQCIGRDIGCGYLTVRLREQHIDETIAARLLAGLYRAVPNCKRSVAVTPEFDIELSAAPLQKVFSREGRWQLGTLGRGNHFVELQRDQEEQLWLLIHSGSRAIGQAISAFHLRDAETDSASGLKFLDADSIAGEHLLNDLQWARQYAAANRLAMLDAIERDVLSKLDFDVHRNTMIHLDHNHVQRESFGERQFWVHRKGAQRLLTDQQSIIPGSMGTTTYAVAGRENEDALNSCSHGAGRSMSRKEAAKRIPSKTFRREMNGVWFDKRNSARLIDEAPSAYKNIREVMKSQRDLVRIVEKRRPVLNFKGR
ncbi:RtcB family protein [Mariniblastus fucicola]|uniref:3'-phosphate/5'-hydroxy nucleic acid ligase n=1 Tax=Mariniblastus fucicola TaxID=980251 RepID=A0A5B9P7W9_9BACT|nr:RtcB family protein [Mariniblastus fucicola]QEG20706.1 RNA-splicing ligase RtcB [Mariniblastus fucicola]